MEVENDSDDSNFQCTDTHSHVTTHTGAIVGISLCTTKETQFCSVLKQHFTQPFVGRLENPVRVFSSKFLLDASFFPMVLLGSEVHSKQSSYGCENRILWEKCLVWGLDSMVVEHFPCTQSTHNQSLAFYMVTEHCQE